MLLKLYNRFKDYVVATLGVLLLVNVIGWHITSVKLDNTRKDLALEKTGRLADRESYKRAQAEYTARALQEKLKKEQEDNEKAAKADADYSTLLSKYNAALVRYSNKTVRSTGGKADLSKSTQASESSDGPGKSAELPEQLIIPYEDAQICAENTARLKAVQEWASSMKKEQE